MKIELKIGNIGKLNKLLNFLSYKIKADNQGFKLVFDTFRLSNLMKVKIFVNVKHTMMPMKNPMMLRNLFTPFDNQLYNNLKVIL